MFKRLVVALICAASPALPQHLELVHRQLLSFDHEFFGGLSGIDIRRNGTLMHLLTDRGRMFVAHVDRSGPTPVLDIAFEGFIGGDTEGLAVAENDRRYVSTEQLAQVHVAYFYCLPGFDPFDSHEGNQGLEALALDDDGSLVALPEDRNADGTYPIYRYANGVWSIIGHLPGRRGFFPVGADFGPDGNLYVLERSFNLLGFRARVRRFDLAAPEDAIVLWTGARGAFDNLEGISLWQSESGETRVTLVSDNDFRAYQRGELVEFILRDPLAKADVRR